MYIYICNTIINIYIYIERDLGLGHRLKTSNTWVLEYLSQVVQQILGNCGELVNPRWPKKG